MGLIILSWCGVVGVLLDEMWGVGDYTFFKMIKWVIIDEDTP